ncbi:MAG: glycosyltransferase family 39 protein [Myxococcota bacterium]|nr:glycosyltransferase family 39 protein [Myxococcota bacterium]
MRSPFTASIVSALLGALIVGLGAQLPLVDDSFFWWVPKAMMLADGGGPWVLAGELPEALRPNARLPPHWADGLPDYAHPPLWYAWLAGWMHLFGKTHTVVHLAVLPVAAGIGAGLCQLTYRLGGTRASWAAPVLMLLPPVSAQLLRADTDLPLLLFSTWALIALLDRKEGLFALLAALATASKEPGVLLVVPALAACLWDRKVRWGWLSPLAILGAWAGIHWLETGGALGGWALSSAEHLPSGPIDWIQDLGSVLRIALLEQGRWLLWPLALWSARKGLYRTRELSIAGSHVLTQLLFFGTLNFLGGIDRVDRYTHVRYLLPGLTTSTSIGLALCPVGALPLLGTSLFFLQENSQDGPESSLYGTDTARALRKARGSLEELEGDVWVGSHAWAQYTRPYSGLGSPPLDSLFFYDINTRPEEVSGHVLHASIGEPLGRLQELEMTLLREFRAGRAWARLYRVHEDAQPEEASSTPAD